MYLNYSSFPYFFMGWFFKSIFLRKKFNEDEYMTKNCFFTMIMFDYFVWCLFSFCFCGGFLLLLRYFEFEFFFEETNCEDNEEHVMNFY